MNGTIKKLVSDKGFGFISIEGGSDIFFHSSGLVGMTFADLHEGDAVTFDQEQAEKGPRAVNVKRA